eukprot:XP_011680944.1 PREDICTED: uncharacterized protein LOC105446178 [Strongylocentrotus purpuratus]
MDSTGGREPQPPGTDLTYQGALDQLVEEAVRNRRLPYPGVLTRMAPDRVPWSEVLRQCDLLYQMALEQEDIGWVGCLQEYLLDSVPHSVLCLRYPVPPPGENICPRDDEGQGGWMYLDPEVPWWRPEMALTHRVPVSIGILSRKYRECSSREVWGSGACPTPGFFAEECGNEPSEDEGVPGERPDTPPMETAAPKEGSGNVGSCASGGSTSSPSGNADSSATRDIPSASGDPNPDPSTPGNSEVPMDVTPEDEDETDPANRPEGYYSWTKPRSRKARAKARREARRQGGLGSSKSRSESRHRSRGSGSPGQSAGAPRSESLHRPIGAESRRSSAEAPHSGSRYRPRGPEFSRSPAGAGHSGSWNRARGSSAGVPRHDRPHEAAAPRSGGVRRPGAGVKRGYGDDFAGGPSHKYRRDRRLRACPIAGCTAQVDRLKWHIYDHMPECFRFRMGGKCPMPNATAQQVTCLRYLARILTGSESVRGLKGYFERRPHPYAYNIPDHFEREVRHLASAAGWSVQATITVLPPSSPAVLIHWRILECFVADLTTDQWAEFRRLGRLPRESGDAPRPQAEGTPQPEATPQSATAPGGPESGTTGPLPAGSGAPDNSSSEHGETGAPRSSESPQGTGVASSPAGGAPPSRRPGSTSAPSYANRAQQPHLPRAFDSHFHLDRLEDSLRGKKGLECVLATPGRPPRIPVHLCGGVTNYIDPGRFGDVKIPESPQFHVAVGIHPKHASKVGERDVDRVAGLVCGSGVTAIGEMGLDFSVPSDRWPAQRSLLRAQLRLVGPGRVLILHLRGNSSDKLGTIPSQECRNMLLSAVTRHQRIHLHCCTLGPGETEAWRKHSPMFTLGILPWCGHSPRTNRLA